MTGRLLHSRRLRHECGWTAQHCHVITLQGRILFDCDKSDLRADAAVVVDTLSAALRKAAPERLEIRGHTDGKGSEDYNQSLSERRAATIEKALKERDVASTMQAQGFGESQPVAENDINEHDNPAGRQLNRRVEIFAPNPGQPRRGPSPARCAPEFGGVSRRKHSLPASPHAAFAGFSADMIVLETISSSPCASFRPAIGNPHATNSKPVPTAGNSHKLAGPRSA